MVDSGNGAARRWNARLVRVAALLIAPSACIYGDSRCSPGQVFYDDAVCACPEGSTYTPGGCVTCGANELPGASGCECMAGFVRTGAGGACEAASAALGAACDTASMPCTDATYGYCQAVSGTGGYCTTSGCTASAQCEAGYACDTSATPAYCQRPPLGLMQPCDTSAECTGAEATFCETFMLNACVVLGCSVAEENCFEGYQCCDFTAFGVPAPICLPAGAC